jgi:hypothetical protein
MHFGIWANLSSSLHLSSPNVAILFMCGLLCRMTARADGSLGAASLQPTHSIVPLRLSSHLLTFWSESLWKKQLFTDLVFSDIVFSVSSAIINYQCSAMHSVRISKPTQPLSKLAVQYYLFSPCTSEILPLLSVPFMCSAFSVWKWVNERLCLAYVSENKNKFVIDNVVFHLYFF